jgi:hypothetical protein
MNFGPEYPKINSLNKRDKDKGMIIIPGAWACEEFGYLADCMWNWTEKIDGTNIRLAWDGHSITVGGRTDRAVLPGQLWLYLKSKLQSNEANVLWTEQFGENREVVVYGEGVGPKIQGNPLHLESPDFIVFDIKIGKFWLKYKDMKGIANNLGFSVVPQLPCVTLREAMTVVQEDYFRSHYPGVSPEGMVGHPAVELCDRMGGRITAKVKVVDFVNYRKYMEKHES